MKKQQYILFSCKKLGNIIHTIVESYFGRKSRTNGSIAEGFDSSKASIISVIPKKLNSEKIIFPSPTKKILVNNLFDEKKK